MKNKDLLFVQKDSLPSGYQKAKLTIGYGSFKGENFACGFLKDDVGNLAPRNNYTHLYLQETSDASVNGKVWAQQNGNQPSDFYYRGVKYSANEMALALLEEWMALRDQTVEVWIRKGGGRTLFILSSPIVANLLKQGRLAFYV